MAAKNELLFSHGVNFNEVPLWQRRGTGLYRETFERPGFNPKTKQTTATQRRRVATNEELPMKDEYSAFIERFLRAD